MFATNMNMIGNQCIFTCMFIFWLDLLGSMSSVQDEARLWYVSMEANHSCAANPSGDIFCDFPQLFTDDRGRCEPFENVTCGDRFEPFTPCEYPNSNCSRPNGTNVSLCVCDPDRNLNYDFCVEFKKSDGLYHWPGTVWSQFYLRCSKNRTIVLQCDNHSEIFDHLREICDSPKNIVQRAMEYSQMSYIPSSFLFFVPSIRWQNTWIPAKETREQSSEISIQQTQSMPFLSTANVYPQDMNQFITLRDPTDSLSSGVRSIDLKRSKVNTFVLMSSVNTYEITNGLQTESNQLTVSERTIAGNDLVYESFNGTYSNLTDLLTTSVTMNPSAYGTDAANILIRYSSSFQDVYHTNIMSSPVISLSLLPTLETASASTYTTLIPTVAMQPMPIRLTDPAIISNISATTVDEALSSQSTHSAHLEIPSAYTNSSLNISRVSASNAVSISHTLMPSLPISPVTGATASTESLSWLEPYDTLVVDTNELTILHTPDRKLNTSLILPISTSSTLSNLTYKLTSLTSPLKETLNSFDQNVNSDNRLPVRTTTITHSQSINEVITSTTFVKTQFSDYLFRSNTENVTETASSILATSFETITLSVSNVSILINYVVENDTSKTSVTSPITTFLTDVASDVIHPFQTAITDISDSVHATPDISSTYMYMDTVIHHQDTYTLGSSPKETSSFRSSPTSANKEMSVKPTTHLDTKVVQKSPVQQTRTIPISTFSTLVSSQNYLETSQHNEHSLEITPTISQTGLHNVDNTVSANKKSFSPMPSMLVSSNFTRSIKSKKYDLLTTNLMVNSIVATRTSSISASTVFSSVTNTRTKSVNTTFGENAARDDKIYLGITIFLSVAGFVVFVLVIACIVCVIRHKADAANNPISDMELSAEEWMPIPENKVIEFE